MTLSRLRERPNIRQVLDCGGPPPLFAIFTRSSIPALDGIALRFLPHLAVTCLLLAGCAPDSAKKDDAPTTTGCRIIRVAFRDNGRIFVAQINQGARLEKNITEFTNWVSELQLSYGDVVVWQSHRNESGKELSIPYDASGWFGRHLTNHQASWYWLQDDDIYKLSLYHWKVPVEHWKSVTNAFFYLEGRLLGKGAEGFRVLLDKIETIPPKDRLVLGCRLPRFEDEPESYWADQADVLGRFERVGWHNPFDFSREF